MAVGRQSSWSSQPAVANRAASDATSHSANAPGGTAAQTQALAALPAELLGYAQQISSADRSLAAASLTKMQQYIQQHAIGTELLPSVSDSLVLVKHLISCLKKHRQDLDIAITALSSLWAIVRISDEHARLLRTSVSPVVYTAREHHMERRVITKVYRILKAVGFAFPQDAVNPLVGRKFHGVSLYRRLLDTISQRQFRNFSNLLLLHRYVLSLMVY